MIFPAPGKIILGLSFWERTFQNKFSREFNLDLWLDVEELPNDFSGVWKNHLASTDSITSPDLQSDNPFQSVIRPFRNPAFRQSAQGLKISLEQPSPKCLSYSEKDLWSNLAYYLMFV